MDSSSTSESPYQAPADPPRSRFNWLATSKGRLAAFTLLYVTEGIPLGFCATAVATYMRREGVSVEEMGLFVGALFAPWGVKWLFGPFVDLIGIERLGRRRGWILFAQIMMVLGLMGSVTIDYTTELKLFTMVMVGVNAFCALQDVAIDALAVASLKDEERGIGNGLMFAGAYMGQALGGAAMLWLAGRTGSLTPAFFVVAGMVAAVTVFVVLPMREAPSQAPRGSLAEVGAQVLDYVITAAKAMLGSVRGFAALALALLPAGAMAMGLALQAALAVELGLSDDAIATLSLVGSIVAASGSVLGGVIADRVGHRKALGVYFGLTLLPTAALALAMQQFGWILPVDPTAADSPAVPATLTTIFIAATLVYGFFSGLTYGARMAVFMKVCDPRIAGTQFTAYMALSNLAISYSAWWQGSAAGSWGYPLTLGLDCAAGIVCLLALPFVTPRPAEG